MKPCMIAVPMRKALCHPPDHLGLCQRNEPAILTQTVNDRKPMADAQYDLFFNGQLLDGHFEDFVKADLKALFRTDDAYIDRLFNGELQTLKTKVDKATAIRFQQAFKKAGAKLIVRPHSAPQSHRPTPEKAAAKPQATPATERPQAAAELTITASAVSGENDDALIEHHQPAITPPEQIPSWDLASPGTPLTDARADEARSEIDTHHLSLASPGSDLSEYRWETPIATIDTEHLSVAPPGAELETLNDDKPAVQVDVSHLNVAE